jgi:hypothetical protein
VRELFELYERDRDRCATLLGIELPAEDAAPAPERSDVAPAPNTASAPDHRDPERDRATEAIAQQRDRRRLALVAGVVAGVLALVLWLGLRGGDRHGTQVATAEQRGQVTAMPIVEERVAELAPPSPVAPEPVAPEPAAVEPPRAQVRRVARVAKPAVEQPTPSPAAAQPPSAADVATLYGALGRELKQLEETKGVDSTMNLWPRYRWIRINDWLGTQERRTEVTQFLEKLRADVQASR